MGIHVSDTTKKLSKINIKNNAISPNNIFLYEDRDASMPALYKTFYFNIFQRIYRKVPLKRVCPKLSKLTVVLS